MLKGKWKCHDRTIYFTKSFFICRYFPENVDIITQLGIVFLKLNDTELAYEKLHALHETENATTESLLALGAILQIKCDAEGALNIYKNIPNIQSEGFEVWNNIGMCFYRKNKLIAVMSCCLSTIVNPTLSASIHRQLHAWKKLSGFLHSVTMVSIILELCSWQHNNLPLHSSALWVRWAWNRIVLRALWCWQVCENVVKLQIGCCCNKSSVEIFSVCLYYLNDIENAKIAFQKAILSSAAIRNPLIYLNYSIFALECIRDVDDARQALSNFYNLCETMKVPVEVSAVRK